MAKKSERIFALVMAMSFLLTTVGVGGIFIWQIMQDKKAADLTSQTTDAKDTKDTKEIKKMDNFTPTTTRQTELKTEDTKLGAGAEVKAGDTVTVDYVGAVMATGAIFDSSYKRGEPATFGLNRVIQGWKEGLVGMKEGGTRRVLIPANLAYAANPPQGSGIPVDADLVFDVTLHKVGQ